MLTYAGQNRLESYQRSSLAACVLILTTTNVAEGTGVTLASLTEAAWTGYTRATLGTLGTPATVGGRASMGPTVAPSFTNTSGSPQTFYGIALLDTSDNTVIDYTLLGSQTLLNGATFSPTTTITDVQE